MILLVNWPNVSPSGPITSSTSGLIVSLDERGGLDATHWRKKANVSREVGSALPPAFPLTKWGVAASFPAVRSSSASPVWNASTRVSERQGLVHMHR